MNHYIFLCGDTVVWCTTEENFNKMVRNDNYKYMGTIFNGDISTGPNIEPFNGKNI